MVFCGFRGVFVFGGGFGVDWLRWLGFLGVDCLCCEWLCGDLVVDECEGDVGKVVGWVCDCVFGDEWCGDWLVFEGFCGGCLRCWGCGVWVGDVFFVVFW